jgi:hypothetical protein
MTTRRDFIRILAAVAVTPAELLLKPTPIRLATRPILGDLHYISANSLDSGIMYVCLADGAWTRINWQP